MSRQMLCSVTGKKVYWNKTSILEVISLMRSQGKKVFQYKCSKCGYFHLTSRKR